MTHNLGQQRLLLLKSRRRSRLRRRMTTCRLPFLGLLFGCPLLLTLVQLLLQGQACALSQEASTSTVPRPVPQSLCLLHQAATHHSCHPEHGAQRPSSKDGGALHSTLRPHQPPRGRCDATTPASVPRGSGTRSSRHPLPNVCTA